MPDERPDFELFIGSTKLESFTNGWVRRELDTLADSFEFQYADLRLAPGDPLPVRAGNECTIKLRGNTLLTGYVDDTSIQYDAESLSLTVRGRSKTGDLVDSSIIRKGGRWNNVTLERIASDICEPFGVQVTVDHLEGIDEVFKRFAVEPGESCIDAIQRAARLRSAWATCTVDGGLHITRAATGRRVPVALEYGKNIISGERFDSWAQRHSTYYLKGQVPSDDEMNGRAASQVADNIVDGAIDRYRPLLLVSTGHDRKGDLKRRAQWERNRRAGTGDRYLYRVDGYGYDSKEYVGQFKQHRRDSYRLWQPNMEVKVEDPRLEATGWFLVAAVSYRWQAEGDDGGRTTDLTVTRKEAFSLQEYPKRKPPKKPKDAPVYFPWQGPVKKGPRETSYPFESTPTTPRRTYFPPTYKGKKL